MLEDPEMGQDRGVPRYFFKISNTYFMSSYKYYHQDLTKGKQANVKKSDPQVLPVMVPPEVDPAEPVAVEDIDLELAKKPSKEDVKKDSNFNVGKTPIRIMNTQNVDDFIFNESSEAGLDDSE